MYTRTKFDIATIIGEHRDMYEAKNGTTINKYVPHYLDKCDALKLSDKVEDLCDEFVIIGKNFTWKAITNYEFAKDNCDFDRGEK